MFLPMEYEIEVHPVGDASKAGDAISIRYWENDHFEVIVIDGGTDDSGTKLVAHINKHYGADAYISHVVCSHPDTDHACGLRTIMSTFKVGTLWLHGIWHHAREMLPYFADKHWTEQGLANAIRENYSVVEELIDLADAQGTPVYEPFAGSKIGRFTVLSPGRDTYLRLVPQFRKTPHADIGRLRTENMYIAASSQSWIARVFSDAIDWVSETWYLELLREGAVTAAENESSTVLFATFGNESVLLTADAGINALHWAADNAAAYGLDIFAPSLVQVPHHGSRSNVSPSILNRLLGPALPTGSGTRGMAVVSAPKDDTTHPRKMVMNAFNRRGYPVYKTQGGYFRKYTAGMPTRPTEIPAVPYGWFFQVEEYD